MQRAKACRYFCHRAPSSAREKLASCARTHTTVGFDWQLHKAAADWLECTGEVHTAHGRRGRWSEEDI